MIHRPSRLSRLSTEGGAWSVLPWWCPLLPISDVVPVGDFIIALTLTLMRLEGALEERYI